LIIIFEVFIQRVLVQLRALSFYSGLVALLRRFGVGPMSEVGDNDEGACWVELESIIRVRSFA
jgi:hypothetical protein